MHLLAETHDSYLSSSRKCDFACVLTSIHQMNLHMLDSYINANAGQRAFAQGQSFFGFQEVRGRLQFIVNLPRKQPKDAKGHLGTISYNCVRYSAKA